MAKIIFFGTPEFALPILRKINNSTHEILTVYTQSPKKSLRGQKINKSVFKVLSPENSIESRNSFGGTASREIKRQIRFWKRRLNV